MGDQENVEQQAAPEGGQAPPPAPAKGSKLKLILIVLVALILGGGGGGAAVYFLFGSGGGASAESHGEADAHGEEEADSHGGGHGEEKEDSHGGGHGAPAKKEESGGHGGGHGGGGEEEAEPLRLDLTLTPVETDLRDSSLKYKVSAITWVEAVDADARAYLETRQHRLVDSAISLLRTKTREELQTVEGRLLLRRQMKDVFEQEVGPGYINAVGFNHLKVSYNR